MHFLNLLAVCKDFKYNSKANCKLMAKQFTAKYISLYTIWNVLRKTISISIEP